MKINIACDQLASETTNVVKSHGVPRDLPQLLNPPYKGSKAMLRIGRMWITSKYKAHLYEARRTPLVRKYMKEKYKWDDETFDSIDWPAIGRCRRKQTALKKMQTCKIMHGWLPITNKNFIHDTTQYPGCVCPRETTNHLLVCPNQVMKTKREEIVAALRKKGLGPNVPRSVANAIPELLEAHFRRISPPSFLRYYPAIQKAVQAQLQVGTNMFLKSFIVKGWYKALTQMEMSRLSDVIKSILTYC